MPSAANAFCLSNMDACAVFSVDGCGEQQTTLSGIATKSNGITTLNSNRMPHSLGFFYSAITQFLGYKPDGDEWKVNGNGICTGLIIKIYRKGSELNIVQQGI